MNITLRIPAARVDMLDSLLEKYTKRAIKLGVLGPCRNVPVDAGWRGVWGDVVVDRLADAGTVRSFEASTTLRDRSWTVLPEPMVSVVVNIPDSGIVRRGSWSLVAHVTRKHDQDGVDTGFNTVRAFTKSLSFDDYRTVPMTRCDHCGVKTHRNSAYVVVSVDGEQKLVGSSCINDFLGHDVSHECRLLEYVSDLVGACDSFHDPDSVSTGRGSSSAMSLEEFLAFAVREFRNGFVSRVKASDTGHQSTADRIYSRWHDYRYPKVGARQEEHDANAPTDADRAAADRLLDPLERLAERLGTGEVLDDFDYHAALTARCGYVEHSAIGLITAKAFFLWKELNSRETAFPVSDSQFFGTVGTRDTFDVEFDSIFFSNGDYGPRARILGRRAATADRFVIWTSGDSKIVDVISKDGILVPGSYRIKATVSEHDDSARFGKQTILMRVTAV